MRRGGTTEKADRPPDSAAPRRAGPATQLFWVGACCAGLLMLAPGTALLLAGLLLPLALVALIPDRQGGPRILQAAALFGLAASVQAVRSLWAADATQAAALAMLRQPSVLFTGWTGILGGWLVSEVAALGLRLHADLSAARQRHALMEQITAIEEEWGPMPASAPLPPME